MSQSTGGHHITPRRGLARIDIDHADNSCSPCLDRNSTCLIKLVRKYVLVVCQCNLKKCRDLATAQPKNDAKKISYNELHHQLSRSGDNRSLSSVVCVLPTNTIILLVKTNHILAHASFSVRFCHDCIEILYDTETVASQGKIVCCSASTCISKIERLLAVERRAWITVWNCHFTQAESVKNIPSVVSHIMKNCSFTGRETQSEPPLLPLHQVAINLK